MAKIFGLFGAMTGKVADVVMVVRNGEQIARKYQPIVTNPSTPAQIAQRAKMKLMSQLSAVMAPVIAIPRRGTISSRNLFVKSNYALSNYTSGEAKIDLNNIQLTQSVVAFPAIGMQRLSASMSAYIGNAESVPAPDVDRVVYCLFDKQNDGRLRFVTSAIATEAGENAAWQVTGLPLVNDEVVVLAYGVRDNTTTAKAVFGNLTALTAETIAKIVVSSTLTESDVTLTETRGYTLAAAN